MAGNSSPETCLAKTVTFGRDSLRGRYRVVRTERNAGASDEQVCRDSPLPGDLSIGSSKRHANPAAPTITSCDVRELTESSLRPARHSFGQTPYERRGNDDHRQHRQPGDAPRSEPVLQKGTLLDERKTRYCGCNRTGYARLDNAIEIVRVTVRYSAHSLDSQVISRARQAKQEPGICFVPAGPQCSCENPVIRDGGQTVVAIGQPLEHHNVR
jgi:hypothetical protein